MSEALINTTQPAPFQMYMFQRSRESWDYFNGHPYPQWAFGADKWPADKGPIPTALGYGEILIRESAEFVFRNGSPLFSTPDYPETDALLQDIIRQNNLNARWISLAENAGNQGAIAAKFSVDLENEDCPIRISFLDVPQECRVWCDPHDKERLLMARIQYPYRDLATGEWLYYREEWTDDFQVTYEPRPAGAATIQNAMGLPDYANTLGDGDGWVEKERIPNPFGLIPVTIIPNRVVRGNPLGEGDCWHVFRLIDRIALTMHGEDKPNQMHSEPNLVITNAAIANTDPLLPAEPMELHNVKGAPPADAKLLEPSGAAREWSHKDIDKWEELLFKIVGLSRVNPAEVTNKGNMTELAFKMTYGRTIATSDRKRQLWGESGMARFFRNMLIALKRLGGVARAAKIDENKIQVSAEFPSYFEPTDEDKAVVTNRTATQVEKGFLTQDRGAERVARAEKIPSHEIKDLLKELQAQREAQAALQAQTAAQDTGASEEMDADLMASNALAA